MPEFKENTSPAMKRSGFKMKYQGSHSAFPFKSPLRDEGHDPEREAGHGPHGKSDPAAMSGITGGWDDDEVVNESGEWVKQSERPDLVEKKKEVKVEVETPPVQKKK